MDKLIIGVRRCREGECEERDDIWLVTNIRTDQRNKEKRKRCGHCKSCRGNCMILGKQEAHFCSFCIKKSAGQNTNNRACLSRNQCQDPEKKDKLEKESKSTKNKASESPEGKAELKLAKLEDDQRN